MLQYDVGLHSLPFSQQFLDTLVGGEIDLLTLILLFTTTPTFANCVDPDQLASEEANWSGSALFAIKYVNL